MNELRPSNLVSKKDVVQDLLSVGFDMDTSRGMPGKCGGEMNRREYLLIKLAEECSEVAHRVSKALCFGSDEKEPGQDFANTERINLEMHDLCAVYEMLMREGFLGVENSEEMTEDRIAAKQAKVEKYLKYSESLGIVTPAGGKRIMEKQTARLENWYTLGKTLVGQVYGHPKLEDGEHIQTSTVIHIDEHSTKAETLNTIYDLGKPGALES